MRPLFRALLLCALFHGTAHGTDHGTRATDLATLIKKIPAIHGENCQCIRQADQGLANQLHAYGAKAIPYLLPLLESKEHDVRNFAAYVLRDLDGLTEEHLPALIAAQQSGNDWISPAIGRIATPTAIQSLVDTLRSKPESNTQVTYAIALSGERAIPYLVALLDTPTEVNPELSSVLCQIFSEAKSETPVDPLLSIAHDEKVTRANRLHAIELIGCIHLKARKAIPALQQLARADPMNFGPIVDSATMAIGSPESVPLLVMALRAEPSLSAFRPIASLHERGIAAGPALVEFLSNSDADLRVGAARALGYIGYSDAIGNLLALLSDPDDWRLAYVAAESLGRMRAQRAIPALAKLASTHWYPNVATAARFAIKVINGEEAYTSREDDFIPEFSLFGPVGAVRTSSSRGPVRPAFIRTADELTTSTLRKLHYDIEIVGWDEKGRHVQHSTTTPVCGLKVPGGQIVGGDRGEWGGELAYMTDQSTATILLKGNTRGIHLLPFAILAVSGLAHLSLNSGALFMVVPVDGGGFKAKRWKTLPGAPIASGMLSNGKLFISTEGGDVVISPDGKLEMANRDNTKGSSSKR